MVSTGKYLIVKLSAKFVAFTFDVLKGRQFTSAVRFEDGLASAAVPESGTMALLGTGLIGLGMLVRKRSSRRA